MTSDSRRDDCKVLLRLWRGSTTCLLQLWPSPHQLCRPLIAPAPKAAWKNYAKSASGGYKVWEISVYGGHRQFWDSPGFFGVCGCIFQYASLEMTRIIHPCLYYEEKTDKDMMQRLEPAEKLFLFNSSKAVDSEIKTSEENPCFSCFVFCFCFFYLWSPFFHIAFRAENLATWLNGCQDVWIDAFMRLHNGKIQQ